MVVDPIAAAGLAAAVIQFVDFGAKLVSKTKEIYQSADGILADHAEQTAVSSRLFELSKGLSQALDASTTRKKFPPKNPSPAEEALQAITRECATYADEFEDAIDRLKISSGNRKWKSFRQALKSVWNKEDINKRLVRLDRLRQEVVIHLLVCMNDSQNKTSARNKQKLDRIASRIIDGIQQHDAMIKAQIQDLGRAQAGLAREQSRQTYEEQMMARQMLVERFLAANKNHVDRLLETLQQKEVNEKRRSFQRKVLDSLHFKKIDDRQNMIDEKHQATLEWVFESPPEMRSQWCEIPAWLEGPDGLYWVSGKAGSGKSTLMKWIFHENRTTRLLRAWSGGRKLLIASFFFWAPGSETQRSLSGLLRSLLYELLRQYPDLIFRVSPARWRSYDLELAHFPAWSNANLLTAMRLFIKDVAQSTCVSFFIDGLDEFVGNDDQRIELVDFLKEVAMLPTVKICVSSRPWELFKDAFTRYPNLRLEDLTRQDIMDTIDVKLQANEKFRSLQQTNNDLCVQLVSEITEKAQGVWLWVILVVRNLSQGLRNEDTVPILLSRLRQIPEKLSALFLQMLNHVEEVYRPETFILLKLALECPRLTLMSTSFIYESDFDNRFDGGAKAISSNEVAQRLTHAARRLNLRCLGLLEITSQSTDLHMFYQQIVDFLHRTARDFLLDPGTQKQVGMESVAGFDVDLYMCKVLLTQIEMSGTPNKALLADFMGYAVVLEPSKSDSLMPLLLHLNDLIESRRDQPWAEDLLKAPIIDGWWAIQPGPTPLLPLALQYGLSTYAKQVLELTPRLVAKSSRRPLLDFALRRRIYSLNHGQAEQLGLIDSRDTPNVEVVRLILANGGDPNAKCGKSTVWKLLMQFFDTFGEGLRLLGEDDKKDWIEVTELLIKNGAARLLEQHTIVPHQSAGKTRVRLTKREVWAKSSISAAFGTNEAERLDSMSWWLELTRQNLSKRLVRSFSSLI